MIDLVEKAVQCAQFRDITLEYLSNFYMEKDNQGTVLLIYNGDDYLTNIGYEEARKFCDQNDLTYFLVVNDKSVAGDKDLKKKAEKIFDMNSWIDYVLLKNGKIHNNKACFYSNIMDIKEQYINNLKCLKGQLQEEGINTYFVKIPKIDDLAPTARHPEWKYESFAAPINWSPARKELMVRYLNRFTELSYDDAKKRILNKESKKVYCGEQKVRSVYLVGPCIVAGWESVAGEELYTVLQKLLDIKRMNYKVICVVMGKVPEINNKAILEYDIKKNDIVVFLEDVIDYEMADLTLDHIYNDYRGGKWLYADLPIHTTYLANKLIADELVQSIIEPASVTSNKACDERILHKGEMQLSYEETVALDKYLDSLMRYADQQYGIIGACVMTCNPFTKGHYHLIEFASKQVDWLYVFIVEEDAFFFPFADRIEMVRQGVRNMKNVIVLPSGRFMISKMTFRNYFEKEKDQEVLIDASKDIMIFKRYIASALRITKRFVGEEPGDNVTNQYNEALKRDLSGEIQVIEIHRMKAMGDIISASKVRNYLKENSWNEIGQMVPQSTLQYLQEHLGSLCMKGIADKSFDRIINFIHSHDRIVICGLGNEAVKLLQYLKGRMSAVEYRKLVFYDKKASQQQYCFENKIVIGFQELISKYRDYYMLIASKAFKEEILCSLIGNEVDPKHIMVAFP